MKMQLNTLGATVLASLVLTTNALAQAPGNGGGGGGFGGRGGQGGFANRMAAGAVTSVDANAGTVTITSRMTGQPQTVKVAAATPIATQTTISITDLKVGDSVQISGVPTAINFTQIVSGDLPTGFPGARNGNQNAGQGNANAANAVPQVQAYAMAVGKVKSIAPLTIDLGNGISLTLNAAAGSKISRISTQTLAGIQVGDQVMSMGQTDADGTFTASAVAVNWPQGGNGGGGGGFGGRGQGGFGGGGFGGGFGGRGRRGGQGGNQGGGQGGGNQGQGGAGANNAPGANVQ